MNQLEQKNSEGITISLIITLLNKMYSIYIFKATETLKLLLDLTSLKIKLDKNKSI